MVFPSQSLRAPSNPQSGVTSASPTAGDPPQARPVLCEGVVRAMGYLLVMSAIPWAAPSRRNVPGLLNLSHSVFHHFPMTPFVFAPRVIFLCRAVGICLFERRFCTQAPLSANPPRAFETSRFGQPLMSAFLYVKLIVRYQVAHVSTPDVYRWCSHTAKVNDPLIGAKEHIYSQMACSNSGNDAYKDHLSSWRIYKSLIWPRCYWRACDELLTWVFSVKHCVESVRSSADPGVRGGVGWAAFSARMGFGAEPGSRGLSFYSHIWDVHSSWTEAGHLTQNPSDEDEVDAHLLISVVLGISQSGGISPDISMLNQDGHFPGTWCSWGSLVHSRLRFHILPLPFPLHGCDRLVSFGLPHQKSTNFIHPLQLWYSKILSHQLMVI